MRAWSLAIFSLLLVVSTEAATVTGKVTIAGNTKAQGAEQMLVWLDGGRQNPAPAQDVLVISQKGMKFTPSFSIATTGQKIEFPNDDNSVHQVYSLSPAKKFNLGFYEPGTTRSIIVENPGVVELKCYIHPHMKGRLLVVPTQLYATVVEGTFTIHDVPPGKYKATLWSAALSEDRTQEIEVTANGGSAAFAVELP